MLSIQNTEICHQTRDGQVKMIEQVFPSHFLHIKNHLTPHEYKYTLIYFKMDNISQKKFKEKNNIISGQKNNLTQSYLHSGIGGAMTYPKQTQE